MTTVNLSPVFNVPFIQDANGNPLNGGKIFAYEAGSNSVLADTYTTAAGDVLNSNPIVLDSSGTLPEAIWLIEGQSYNLVLTDSSGTTVLKGFDDVTGVPTSTGGGGGGTSSIWVTTAGATYQTPTQFLVAGNLTAEYAVGNRVRITLSGGFTYGVVSAVSFSGISTLVTIINDGAVLNSSLSVAEYSVLIASPGETVDAGGVSFFDAMAYGSANTVGWKIKQVEESVTALTTLMNSRVNATYNVQTTSGTGTITATADSAITSYSVGQKFTVKFANANTGAATININGIGAKSLFQYDSSGAKVNPTIVANMLSQIAYDGTDFVVLDPLPAAPAGAAAHGRQVITSNTTFTVPVGVSWINVTVIGGGGGGGNGYYYYNPESGDIYYTGGSGGLGGMGVKGLSVTAGSTHAVSIGAGGTGGSSSTAGGTTTFGAGLASATGGGRGTNGSYGSYGTNGAQGTSTGSDYSIAGQVYSVGGALRGVGGSGGDGISPGTAGSAGLCIVEW